jgi:rieske iron-sulfur protein
LGSANLEEKGTGDNNSSPGISRRNFLELMASTGTVMAFAPFVDWSKFLANAQVNVAERAKAELPDGSQANINTFPINHSEVVIYPKTDDLLLNKDAFRTWQLIRLPAELGGGKNDVSAFRLYSAVCLHLWCLWRYVPLERDSNDPSRIVNGSGQCPCHGSAYDPLDGKAFSGPAADQSPPSNVLPILYLEADEQKNLWILPPTFDVNENGIVGYGRFLKT